MVKELLPSCLVAFLLLLSGCGEGGTANTAPLSTNKGIVLSADLKQGLADTSSSIIAIQVEFKLPVTATPNLDGATLLTGETGLTALNHNGNIQFGSFDPTTRMIKFTILANDLITGDLGAGDIARLAYETSSGVELTAQEIKGTLSYKVSGPGSADISNEIEPSVRIVKY